MVTVSVSDSVYVILAATAMETDAAKQKEESAGNDAASAAVSKGDAPQVCNVYMMNTFIRRNAESDRNEDEKINK